MKHFITKTMLALGVAATVMAGAYNPAISAPLASGSTAVKEAAPTDDVIEVRRWRGRHWGGALLGLGALALIYEGSRRHHRGYYYGHPHGYYGGRYGGRTHHNNYTSRIEYDCSHRGRWVC